MAVQSVSAVINGQTVNLTYNAESGKYEATVTAPTGSSYPRQGHYYPVSVTATDDAGNVAYCAKYIVTIDISALTVRIEPFDKNTVTGEELFFSKVIPTNFRTIIKAG